MQYVENLQTTETQPDKAYKWLIRSLYLAAITINVWYLTESVKQTDEGKAMFNRAKARGRRWATVLHGKAFFRDHVEQTMQEAEDIVRKADNG